MFFQSGDDPRCNTVDKFDNFFKVNVEYCVYCCYAVGCQRLRWKSGRP